MECPICGYAMGPFDKECERCKRYARDEHPAPSEKRLPPVETAGSAGHPSPPGPAQVNTQPAARPSILPSDPGLVAAGVVCFLVSVSLLGLALLQLALASSGEYGDLLFYAFLNMGIGAAYVAFGIGVIMRAPWAQDWAYWSSWLNGVFGGLQVINGAWLFIPVVAFSFVIVGLLHGPYRKYRRSKTQGKFREQAP